MNEILKTWAAAAVLGRIIGVTIRERWERRERRQIYRYQGPVPPVIKNWREAPSRSPRQRW